MRQRKYLIYKALNVLAEKEGLLGTMCLMIPNWGTLLIKTQLCESLFIFRLLLTEASF